MCLCLCLCRLRLRLRRRWPVKLPVPARNKPHVSEPLPGLYDYARHDDGGRTRLHLRLEPDGSGLLMVNADRSAHLNPSAALLAWHILEGHSPDEAVHSLQRRYRVSGATAHADFRQLAAQLDELCRPDGACPIHDLQLDVLAPFTTSVSAPYRMDLAITYRCNANCAHCYNARPRDYPELGTGEWLEILRRVRQIGIPHVCFTGGEATLRRDLPELVAGAQALGLVVGLLSNGRRLADHAFTQHLAQAGLDHVQITLESHDPAIHDRMVRAQGAWQDTVAGVRNALDCGLYLMTNTTLLDDNAGSILQTIDFLAELGVPTVGCNALIYSGKGSDVGAGLAESQLRALLPQVRQRTEQNRQKLIWYSPTQYCHFDPVQMDLGVKGCTAARYNLCVEPDGAVIPCQSYYQSLGNLLNDSWDSIWDHPLAVWLRERRYVPDACHDCPVLAECGGGCPLSLAHLAPDLETATAVPVPA